MVHGPQRVAVRLRAAVSSTTDIAWRLEEVDSPEDFEEALREASEEGKERVPLLVNRRGRESFLTLEVEAG